MKHLLLAALISLPAFAKCPSPQLHFPELGISCKLNEPPCNKLPEESLMKDLQDACDNLQGPGESCPSEAAIFSNGSAKIACSPVKKA